MLDQEVVDALAASLRDDIRVLEGDVLEEDDSFWEWWEDEDPEQATSERRELLLELMRLSSGSSTVDPMDWTTGR